MGIRSSYCSPHLMRRNSWSRQVSALLVLGAWAICVGLLHASPAKPQATCGAGHCAYLPLVSVPLPIKITFWTQIGSCKGQCNLVTGVLDLTGAQPVYDVTLEARVFDAGGQLLQTEVITPVLAATIPGQHNRFSFADFSASFYNHSYDVSIRNWSTTSSQTYSQLTIVSQEGYIYDPLGLVRGVVRNDQPAALTNIKILAEIDGVGTDYGSMTITRLEPGESTPFRIDFVYPCCPDGPSHPVVQGLGQLEP